MGNDWIGLTQLYNRFHDAGDRDPRIQELRTLHLAMDIAVADAYGWGDLDLSHDFHEVSYLPANDRVRFTISETVRVALLRRLSELNHQRYEEEQASGSNEGADDKEQQESCAHRTRGARPNRFGRTRSKGF
jgi:hypothetical protein